MTAGNNYVETYNAMVEELIALGNNEYKPVKRFSDNAKAEQSCRELNETLEALRANGPSEPKDAPEEIANDINDAKEAVKEKVAEEKPAKKERKRAAKKAKAKIPKAKAAAPVAAKPKTKAKTKTATTTKATAAEQALDVRPGTKKAKLLAYLLEHKKEKLSRTKLIGAVYGKPEQDFIGPFSACMAGLNGTMLTKKWGTIKADKEGKELCYVFDSKSG